MIINNDGLLNDPVSAAGVSHTPECQMWAVWALANLTSVTPDKYCRWLSATCYIHHLTDCAHAFMAASLSDWCSMKEAWP